MIFYLHRIYSSLKINLINISIFLIKIVLLVLKALKALMPNCLVSLVVYFGFAGSVLKDGVFYINFEKRKSKGEAFFILF